MALYVGSTVINCADVKRGVAFWTAALGYTLHHGDETFALLTDPKRRWSNMSIQLTEDPKQGRNRLRLHLDLYTNDQKVEVARLESLGARRPQWTYPPGSDFVVMTDPDGNEFCVI